MLIRWQPTISVFGIPVLLGSRPAFSCIVLIHGKGFNRSFVISNGYAEDRGIPGDIVLILFRVWRLLGLLVTQNKLSTRLCAHQWESHHIK